MPYIDFHGEALGLLSSLNQSLLRLAAGGTPEQRARAFEIADHERRLCRFFMTDISKQLLEYPNPADVLPAALQEQAKRFDGILAQVDEVTVFWDTSIFEADSEVSANALSHCFDRCLTDFFLRYPAHLLAHLLLRHPSSRTHQESDVRYRKTPSIRQSQPKNTLSLCKLSPFLSHGLGIINYRLNAIVRDSMNRRKTQPPSEPQWQPTSQRMLDLQNKITAAKSEIDDAVSQRSRTPASAVRQLQDKDAKIESLEAELATLQGQMAQLIAELQNKDIRLAQANETIAIHSGEMSKFQNRPPKYQCQPFRLPSQVENMSQGQHQGQSAGSTFPVSQGYAQPYNGPAPHSSYNQQIQPPPGLGLGNQGMLTTKWGVLNHGPSSPYQQADPFTTPHSQARVGATSYGSPMPINQMQALNLNERAPGGGGNASFTTPPRQLSEAMSAQDKQSATRPASQLSSSDKNKGALVPLAGDTKEAKMKQSFQALIDEAVVFAHKHVNMPSTQGDSNMPENLKSYLLNLASKTTANRIMSNQNTRYFLVGKLILEFIINQVFPENSFFGFNGEIDNAIRVARSKLYVDTPSNVRKAYLQEIAKQFTSLKTNTDFEQWVTKLVYDRAVALWNRIRPLMYAKVDGDWVEVHTLMTNAHKIALSMLSDDTEFRFDFPATNAPFTEVTMINMDPEYRNIPAHSIMAAGGLVRLGAIPQVSIRVTAVNGNEVITTLVKAGVLVVLPHKK